MSDHLCPHCGSEFSNTQEAETREEVTRQNRLNELKEQFRKDSGWEARRRRFFIRFLLASMVSTVMLFLTAFVPELADVETIFESEVVIIPVILVWIMTIVVGLMLCFRFDRKEDEAFRQWRTERGV